MKDYYLLIPYFVVKKLHFDTWEQAEQTAKNLLKQKNIGYRFISAFKNDKLLTIFIKPGYDIYSFKSFKYLDEIGKISDYFILNQGKTDSYYIKIKK